MAGWLRFAHAVDWLSARLGTIAAWMVLLACVVSAGNAAVRYLVSMSSNAWLELQWYMFAAMVMFGAPYVLKVNEHVRVDILYGRLPVRARAWIDLLGLIFFLMPATVLFLYLAWPFFYQSWAGGEMSGNAGGLARWYVKLTMPVGFFALAMQGLAEILKRVAYLRGLYHMDLQYERPLQ